MAKKKKQSRRSAIVFDCNCGVKHQLILGLGELQVLERNIVTGKNTPLKIQVKSFAPAGRTLGDGSPEYVEFKREPQK